MTARAKDQPAKSPPVRPARPDGMRWYEPDDPLEELELGGPHGVALQVLVRELRHVDRFTRAKIDPPTRILFSGPSGTGKTMAARWLGAQLGIPLAVADVAKAMGSHLGESANRVGQLFDDAASARAILFLDEIDAIAVQRDSVGTASSARELARATTTMFQRLDWAPVGQIIIAATNFRDELDDALRRRFSTRVVFELPDAPTRRRMIGRWLAGVRAGADTLDRLTAESEGLSGADTRSLAMARGRALVMADVPLEQSAPDAPKVDGPPAKTPQQYMESLFATLDEIERRRTA